MNENAPFFVRIMYEKGDILQYYPVSWNHSHALAVPLASGPIKAPWHDNCQGDYTAMAVAQAARGMAVATVAAAVVQAAARGMAVATVAAAAVVQAAVRGRGNNTPSGFFRHARTPFS